MGVEWPVPRFTDNGDGTVRDNLTGLIWLKDANCSLFNAPRNWYDALGILVPQLENGYCGLSDGSGAGDWRLPNLFELQSLHTLGNLGIIAVPNTTGTGYWTEGDPFQNVQESNYWTSTNHDVPHPQVGYVAWIVDMDTVRVDFVLKTELYYVWPVRGGHQGTTTTVLPTTTSSIITSLCDETTDCGEGYCCGYASVIEAESGDPLYCTPKTNDAICFFCESQSDCTYSTVYICCCSECPILLPPASFCINQVSCLVGCESTCMP